MSGLDGVIERVLSACRWLALPIALMLFLQWPLRSLGAYSREANDLGQILFAYFVAAGVTAATRRREHLATDVIASRYSGRLKRLIRIGGDVLAVVPWSAFVIWSAWPSVSRSVLQAERFAETSNPGYFLIKVALMFLAALMVLQALLDIVAALRATEGETRA